MKVVIVGAGICGLATYLHLKKLSDRSLSADESLQVTLFEKHDADSAEAKASSGHDGPPVSSVAGVGGALGVSPNGMHVLQDLNEDLYHDILDTGNAINSFSMRTASGWRLAQFRAHDRGNPSMPTVLIGRYDLWRILRSRVPDADLRRANVACVMSEPGRRPQIRFTDGSPDVEADLVIGADGVRSVVRRAVTDDPSGEKYPATYEGLSSVFGWIPSSLLGDSHSKDEMVMTLGADGFFGYGIHASSSHTSEDQGVWWSTYPLEANPLGSSKSSPEDLLRNLQNRHRRWGNPTIQRITANAYVDCTYPTWTTPELPTWILNGSVVLVGDAAHAMQTSSGQGVSQALEDAQVLSTLLVHGLTKDGAPAVEAALKAYVDLRKPRVDRIVEHGKRMGDTKRRKGLIEEWVTYLILWIMGKWSWDGGLDWLYGELPRDELKKICLT